MAHDLMNTHTPTNTGERALGEEAKPCRAGGEPFDGFLFDEVAVVRPPNDKATSELWLVIRQLATLVIIITSYRTLQGTVSTAPQV